MRFIVASFVLLLSSVGCGNDNQNGSPSGASKPASKRAAKKSPSKKASGGGDASTAETSGASRDDQGQAGESGDAMPQSNGNGGGDAEAGARAEDPHDSADGTGGMGEAAHEPGLGDGSGGSLPESPSDAGMQRAPSGLPDVEFSMEVTVPAGAEQLRCIYAAMPTDRGVIAVNSAESHYTPGSHHMLAYRSDLIGVPQNQTGVFDCQDADFTHNKGSYYEAQQPDSHRDLPEGVAHLFQPNEVVIIQAHYVNATTHDVAAHVQLILHTMDPADVKYEAGSILFSNGSFSIPAHTKQRVTLTCPIAEDFNPALLWSHMHHRSSNFIATTDDDAAAAALGTLYMEPDWAEPQPREYPSDPPVTLHAGSHITFSCDMTNETDGTITYGNSAEKNEMCILHGMYWPRMTKAGAESCRGGMSSHTTL